MARPTATVFLLVLVLASSATAAKLRPDLSTRSVKGAPTTLSAGTRFTVKVKVRNAGRRTAGRFTITLFLGTRAKHTSKDVRIGKATIRRLKAHRSKTVKIKAVLPQIRSAAVSLAPGSYELIACADTGRKIKERSEKNNCRAQGRKFRLNGPAPPGPAPPGPPAPAFALSDNWDWAFSADVNETQPVLGSPVTVLLTAANGFAGQSGYTRSNVAQAVPTGGTSTPLGPFTGGNDDGTVSAPLPFTFAFAGIPYQSVSVSTNGWLSFDEPAWDYWDDSQTHDFRGAENVVSRFYRGLMPYIADLDLDPGTGTGAAPAGTVSETSAPGFVTFTWSVGQHTTTDHQPVRNFSVTLFPDGSFRYDYVGTNSTGGGIAFVGYSTGNGGIDDVAFSTTAVPSSSLLFTPKPVSASGPAAAGVMTTTLPRGATLASADAGCSTTTPATATADGLITCAVPAIGVGQTLVRHLTWTGGSDALDPTSPVVADFAGTYQPAGVAALTDDDEFTNGNNDFPADVPTHPTVTYTGPTPPVHDTPMTFQVHPVATGNLINPKLSIQIPAHTTLDSIKVGTSDYAGCLPQSGSTVTCLIPGGFSVWGTLVVTLTPDATTVGNPISLSSTLTADNSGVATAGHASSGNVT